MAGAELVAGAGGVTNGLVGAWGPVVTPFLLHKGLSPRYAIGSTNTAEVAVAVVAAGSLFATTGGDGVDAATVAAMLTGGVIASPLAAWVLRFVPPRALGLAVAALLLLTNVRDLSGQAELGAIRWLAYAAVVAAVAIAATRPRWQPSVRCPLGGRLSPWRARVAARYSAASSRTSAGRSSATRSATVTVSNTRRRLARMAIHTSGRAWAGRRIDEAAQALVVDVGQGPVDGPKDVGQRDLGR